MPKDTFNNLSNDKKQIIFEAAVQEFSTRRFSEASINQIVKTAEISRGSFYQYFKDKEDIYLYMMTEIGKEKMEIIKGVGSFNPDADFFEAYIYMIKVILEWSKAKPVYNRIAMLMEIDDSEFIAKMRERLNEGFTVLCKMIERDQQRGLIKPEVDAELVVEMIYTLNMHFLKEYIHSDSYEGLLTKSNEILQIIRNGIKS